MQIFWNENTKRKCMSLVITCTNVQYILINAWCCICAGNRSIFNTIGHKYSLPHTQTPRYLSDEYMYTLQSNKVTLTYAFIDTHVLCQIKSMPCLFNSISHGLGHPSSHFLYARSLFTSSYNPKRDAWCDPCLLPGDNNYLYTMCVGSV